MITTVRTAIPAIVALLLSFSSWGAEMEDETALQVQSWCREVINAKLGANDTILLKRSNFYTGFCWGAFASIQQFSTYVPRGSTDRLLYICTPPTSTRLQLIKIFSKYVDDHPETAHEDFSDIAFQALVKAFPCSP
jgi:hypothetical protein